MARPVPRTIVRRASVAGAAFAALTTGAHAVEIDTGNPDLMLRWDTQLKYSASARVNSADPVYLNAGNANGDDGDRNFSRGLISNRFDVFSEADVVWRQDWGARVSGAAYYDRVYNRRNDNPGFAGGAFPNNVSVPANRFTEATRNRMGRYAELLDAFAFGKLAVGSVPVTFRLGQHGLVWGESLFFGANAIAGDMVPVDAVRLASIPATQFKEAIRPVPMISGTAQLTQRLSLGAYYQFQWAKTVIPPAGSYIGSSDILQEGGETLLVGPAAALRLPDRTPKNSGQGGLQLRYSGGDIDFGAYAVRYHSKGPQPVVLLGLVPNPGPGPAFVPFPTNYYLAYPQGITHYAVSASKTVFELYNVAVEAGVRHNALLASTQFADTSAFTPTPATNVTNNPGYATGKTAHVNLSLLAQVPSTPLWREATLAAEVAWSRALSVTKNLTALDPNSTRDGVAMRFVFTPTYRSVFPGVDIGVPIGASWAPKGSRPLAAGGPPAWIPQNGGDTSIGIDGSFRDAWRFTAAYTHFYGARAPVAVNGIYQWKQALGDRDFVSASLRYAF